MTDQQFADACDAAFEKIETALEAVQDAGADVDFVTKGEGVLEISLEKGGKIIINRNTSAREIWVASPGGGFHFYYDGALWLDTRDKVELLELLHSLI